ncbi:MAG: hypothetical protein QOJ85_3127 [Solirubrobacteraceae bacterium]|jgi:hypothetical protein|nr:hypothetical protein [Solirubrobacteraceae bacterium]MEA2241351.1 hypothetical protein [Solirubrobacteraceae bacterium]
MPPKTLTLGCALATLAVSACGAAPALADSAVVADPTAQNVTAYGSTAAWSRKAADGYHLVVAQGGATADAPVPASSQPYDPDLGPTKANGRAIVYARGGDLYRYDVGAAGERKLTSLSSAATETAPSFFKDTIVFSRTTGTRTGLYIKRPGRSLTRLFRTVAAETDVAQTRVIGRFGEGTRSIIRILNMNATDVKIVARAKTQQRMASPTLTRFNGIWLRVGATRSTVEQVGVNAHRGLHVLTADRPLPGHADSLATYGIPLLYTNDEGVERIAPKLRFR